VNIILRKSLVGLRRPANATAWRKPRPKSPSSDKVRDSSRELPRETCLTLLHCDGVHAWCHLRRPSQSGCHCSPHLPAVGEIAQVPADTADIVRVCRVPAACPTRINPKWIVASFVSSRRGDRRMRITSTHNYITLNHDFSDTCALTALDCGFCVRRDICAGQQPIRGT